jgi:peptide methionine sulfoxide reductase MsrA
MEGVERVVLGYTGGKKEKPTFTKIIDHTEALLVEFNPQKVSYRQILEVWHECDSNPWEKEKAQYRSALFWKSLSQQDTALQFIQELQAKNPNKKLHSEVERARRFYRAKQTCPELPLEPKQEGNEIVVVACGNFVDPQRRFEEVRLFSNMYLTFVLS